MGFRVPAGSHEIELIYHTPGLTLGLILTAAAALLIVVYMILDARHLLKFLDPGKKKAKKKVIVNEEQPVQPDQVSADQV